MNFVFYDTETTGTDTAFSQILQFAAILTDADLNIIDRFEIRCQLLPHIIPSPMAMKVTKVSLKQLTDPKLPTYYQMMCLIRKKLESWSPAIFLGYNSLKYDETLLRQAFYQTLHPLYLTNTNGNCRMDVMAVVQIVSLFTPNILNIPFGKDRNTYRLELVAPHNGFDHKNAHDAMADVLATIHLADLIKKKTPEIWDCFVRFSKKNTALEFGLNTHVFSVTEFNYSKPYTYFGTAVGTHPDNKAEIIVFDLVEDPTTYVALSLEDLIIRFKKSPKPMRRVKSNTCPTLRSLEETFHIPKDKRLDDAELSRRAALLKSNSELCERLITAYVKSRGERVKSDHVEKQIYDGFFSQKDQALLDLFHTVPWEERNIIINQFEDHRSRTLGLRLLYCERPDLLEKAVLAQYETAIAKRLLHCDDNRWLTLLIAMEEIEKLLIITEESERQLMDEHKSYLVYRHGEATKMISFKNDN